ncbi:EcsC family protein [Rossellomorea aquimaris]|uniref:EcsC family protein n=1 Tax=Rossellomorea aquimaris TaxID=189382 RepID=UPI001CFF40D4|nr:EcsC family protein [Rossellomorea aquimaris]
MLEDNNKNIEKPAILKAIDIIIASPESIQKEVRQMEEKYKKKYSSKLSEEELEDRIAEHIISNYSYYTAFTGGATALTGVVPGLGTVIASVGGATADAAVTMKWEIEMVMALATVYGRDITIEEEKRICYLVAGFGVLNEAAKKGAIDIGGKALGNMAKQYLKGPTLVGVKEVFKKVGLKFTRKALEKSIPFGVGVVIGFSANKGLTWYVGKKARDFFKTRDFDIDDEDLVVA